MTVSTENSCSAPLHPQAAEGLRLFNAGEYFEAHEALEDAWNAEQGEVRNLYRGILQIAVVYLHITRGNYNGAIKVYERSQRWLKAWADVCQGIEVETLRRDAEAVIQEIQRLGSERIKEFDTALLKPVSWDEGKGKQKQAHTERETTLAPGASAGEYTCDRCGIPMFEKNCKITCPNCGNRFDCSDLNIYFD